MLLVIYMIMMFGKMKMWQRATVDLQFDMIMVQKIYHPILKLSFQVIELLLTLLQFSHIKQL